METIETEWEDAGSLTTDRPSAHFLRAVADLLETDAEDLLYEMGYLPNEALVAEQQPVAA